MKTTAIMPAYNEEVGIAEVIKAVKAAKLVDEIIVVSDGSTDKTVEIAKTFDGVNVIEQNPNKGKAAAMHLGVSNTDADVLLFIDCDLISLTPEMVDGLVKPILDDTADVTMGIFQGGKFSTDWAQKTFPFLTGQRGMKKSVWDGADIDVKSGYAVEVHLTKYMAKENLRVENVILAGCSQYLKEQKTKGKVLEGFGRRLKMTWEIAKALFMPDFDDIADIFAPKRRSEDSGSGEDRERRPRYNRDREGGGDRFRKPRGNFDRKPWVADGEFNKSWRDKRDDERRERRPRRDDAEGSTPSEGGEGGEERRPARREGFFPRRDDSGEGFRRGPGRPRKNFGDSEGGDRPPRREGGFFKSREGGDRKPFFGNRDGGERRGPGRPRKYGDDRPFGDRPPRRPRD